MATTNQYLTNNTLTSTTVWTNAPIALADGGTGASLPNGTSGQVLTSQGDGTTAFTTLAAGGNVTGPGSSTANDFAIFSNASGQLIADAGFSIVPITKGGTGATTQAAALSAILGGTFLSIANGGTGAATQTAALSNILGSSVISTANGGLGAVLSPSTVGDMLYSADGATWSVIPAPLQAAYDAAQGPVVLTFTALGALPTYMAG